MRSFLYIGLTSNCGDEAERSYLFCQFVPKNSVLKMFLKLPVKVFPKKQCAHESRKLSMSITFCSVVSSNL